MYIKEGESMNRKKTVFFFILVVTIVFLGFATVFVLDGYHKSQIAVGWSCAASFLLMDITVIAKALEAENNYKQKG